jgi:protein involved in polysaccharide export with SLBB domain
VLVRDTLTSVDERASEVIEINNGDDLTAINNDIQLKAFDVITIRRKPGYTPLASVIASGQLQYPGPYVISRRSERISDLIRRAGGFTPEAFIEGAYLKRSISDKERQLKRERVRRLQENMADTSALVLEDIERRYDQIPLDLHTIINKPGSISDLIIKEGDELYVPKFDAQVRISGGVLMPTQIPFDSRYSMKDYLSSAGGVSQDAMKRKIYVLYANGRASSTRHFLFFKKYPKVKAGAEVVVPKKLPKVARSTGEIVGFASVLTSLAGVIIALLNVTK